MNKVNNKGFTIIEIILSFSFIMIISVGLFMSATNYKNKQQEVASKRDLESYKMNIISDIHKVVDEKGVVNIDTVTNGKLLELEFNDMSTVDIIKNEDGKGITINKGGNNITVYDLKEKEISTVKSISLQTSEIDIGTSKAKIYKITIEIEHNELGDFPINIVLPVFSKS